MRAKYKLCDAIRERKSAKVGVIAPQSHNPKLSPNYNCHSTLGFDHRTIAPLALVPAYRCPFPGYLHYAYAISKKCGHLRDECCRKTFRPIDTTQSEALKTRYSWWWWHACKKNGVENMDGVIEMPSEERERARQTMAVNTCLICAQIAKSKTVEPL